MFGRHVALVRRPAAARRRAGDARATSGRSSAGRSPRRAAGRPARSISTSPFREPLVPAGRARAARPGPARRSAAPTAVVARGRGASRRADAVADLAGRVGRRAERGLIVAGPQDDPALPGRRRAPRGRDRLPDRGRPAVGRPLRPARSDVRARPCRSPRPARPVARRAPARPGHPVRGDADLEAAADLARRGGADQIVVDGDRALERAGARSRRRSCRPTRPPRRWRWPTTLERAGARRRAATDGSWARDWCDADRAADAALGDWLAGVEARGEAFEGLPFAVLGDVLPDGALLWAGNSMPVRDLDDWLRGSERAIRPLSNRGANGIDGVVSTALGVGGGRRRSGRPGGRRRVVPARPERPRRGEAPRAVGDDRAGRQRRRRDLLVPAAGRDRRARGRAARALRGAVRHAARDRRRADRDRPRRRVPDGRGGGVPGGAGRVDRPAGGAGHLPPHRSGAGTSSSIARRPRRVAAALAGR